MNNIDILEEFIKRVKKEQEKYKDNLILQEIEKHCFYGDVPLQAIETLITENKELKEEKDSLKKEVIHWKGEYHLENRKYLDLYNKKVSIPKINATEEMLEQYVEKVKIIKAIEELEKDENLINAEYFIKRLQSLLGKE